MREHLVLAIVAAGIAPVFLMSASLRAQPPLPKAPEAKNWTPPKTAWGHPDLEGTYTNSTIVPLERPPQFAGKPELTEAEAEARFKQYRDGLFNPTLGGTGFYNEFWWEWGKDVKRTSLIIDPPDGRLPLTPQAQERAKTAMKRMFARPDGPEDFNAFDRCIARGLPGAMMPGFYNHYYQIIQTRDYVVLSIELVHDARIIPLGDRPHIPAKLGQWLGDSRGRWQGNTLVVETTNLNDKVMDRGATFFGVGPDLKLVERFTRIGPEMIDYEFTVTAPSTFTQPWTASIPLWKTDLKIFEYACHEGNYAIQNMLKGARAEDAASASGRKP